MSERIPGDYASLCRLAVEAVAAKAREMKDPAADERVRRRGAHAAYGRATTLAMAYFDPASPARGEEAVAGRLEGAMQLLEAAQHDDGLIDLWVSNFHSPPDTAFMVEELVPLYEVLRDQCPPSAAREGLLKRLERVIVRACDGIAAGGVHTPNHRWKVASALTLADRIWPHDSWRREAQEYLAEGIDIDADGEFTERSTGCYNYVCDRAMILLDRATGRGEYAGYADRNLEHMLYLLHADRTLVTSYSRRQDRDEVVGLERYFLLYWYRALTAGHGLFWSAAELCLRRLAASGTGALAPLAKWLRYFREAGERTPPRPEPLPEEYEKKFDAVGILRRRSGRMSLTLMAGSGDILSVRFGAGPEIGLRVAAAFAPRGQFLAEEIAGRDGRYQLRSHHPCEYYGPGPDPLPGVDWRSRPTFSRRVFLATELTLTLGIEVCDEGLRLRLRSEGCQHVPVEVAFLVRLAREVTASGHLEKDEKTGKHFCGSGEVVARGADHVVRIGPGAGEHDLSEMSTGQRYPTGNAYCLRYVTPVDVELTIQAEGR